MTTASKFRLSRRAVLKGAGAIAIALPWLESLALAASMERFGATFFGNGSTFGGIIRYPADVCHESADT